MRKVAAILLLLIFSIYAFNAKTHYCYHQHGGRFHGDCTAYLKKSSTPSNTGTVLNERKYVCYDVLLDKAFKQTDDAFKGFSDCLCQPVLLHDIALPAPFVKTFSVPVFACRGGPPLLIRSLRAPPVA